MPLCFYQDDQTQRVSVLGHPSRPASRNAFDDSMEPLRSGDVHLLDGLRASNNVQSVMGPQNNAASPSPTFASVVGSSLSRSNTPDPQLVARAPSPRLPPVGVKIVSSDKKINSSSSALDRTTSTLVDSDDLMSALSAMNISNAAAIDENRQSSRPKEPDDHQRFLFDLQGGQNSVKPSFMQYSDPEPLNVSSARQSAKNSFPGVVRNSTSLADFSNAISRSTQHVEMHKSSRPSNNSYLKGTTSNVRSPGGSPVHYSRNSDGTANSSFTTYGLNGYSVNSLPSMMSNHVGANNLPPLFESAAAASGLGSPAIDAMILGGGFSSASNLSGSADLQNLNKIGSHTAASALQMPLLDPLYIQYLNAAQAATNYNDPSFERAGFTANSYADSLGIQKAYLGALLQQQKQFGMPFLGKSGYYGSPFGLGMSYQGSPLASPILPGSPVGSGSPLRHGERNMHLPSGMRNLAGGVMGSWHLDGGGNIHDGFASSLLEEFKNNKTKCYELSDIAGHVVEFRYMSFSFEPNDDICYCSCAFWCFVEMNLAVWCCFCLLCCILCGK